MWRTYFRHPSAHELELAIKESQFSRYNFIFVSRAFYAVSILYLHRAILIDNLTSWMSLEDCHAINKWRVCNQLDTPLNSLSIWGMYFLTAWISTQRPTGEQTNLPNPTICRPTRASISAYGPGLCRPLGTRYKVPLAEFGISYASAQCAGSGGPCLI
jgi:hypothetical protein